MITEITGAANNTQIHEFLMGVFTDMVGRRVGGRKMTKMEYETSTRQLTIYNMDGTVQRMSIQQIN